MSRVIATIEEEDIIENDDGTVSFTAKAAIDSDGSGPHFGDSTAQDDTSLHQDGEPLNAQCRQVHRRSARHCFGRQGSGTGLPGACNE